VIRRPKERIRRNNKGEYEVRLPAEERALLVRLPDEIDRELRQLEDPHAPVPDSLRRLFPPAFPTDEDAQSTYAELVRGDLVAHHRAALATLVNTASATLITEPEAEAWLAALNDIRLAIGSTLGVTEEPKELLEDDPDFVAWVCYHYLSYLQGEVIDALAAGLPDDLEDDGQDLPNDPWGDPPGGLRWDGTEVPPQP
jgi:hypothetical protein